MRTTKHIAYLCPISGPCYYTLEFNGKQYQFVRKINMSTFYGQPSYALVPKKYQVDHSSIVKLDTGNLPGQSVLTVTLITNQAVEDDFKQFEDFISNNQVYTIPTSGTYSVTLPQGYTFESNSKNKHLTDMLKSLEQDKQAECWHDWQSYTGLFETYTYCSKCGKKK